MRVKVIIGLLALIVIISLALSLQTDRKVTTKSDQAYNYFLAGIEDANRLYNNEALENLEAAVMLDSSFASAWAYLSKYYAILGQKEEASIAADLAFDLSQDLPERERLNIHLVTCGLRDDCDNFDEILDYMLKEFPEELDPHLYKAGIYWKENKIVEAIEEYETAYQINPNYALIYNELGYLHATIGDLKKAIEYMKKYVFIAPDQANPHDSLGDILIRVGRYREAIDHLRSALSVKPNLAAEPNNLGHAIYLHLATANLRLGRLKQTEQHLNRAIELAPNEWMKNQVITATTELFRTQRKYAEGIESLKRVHSPEKFYKNMVLEHLAYLYSDINRDAEIMELIDKLERYLFEIIREAGGDSIEVTSENYKEYISMSCKSEGINRRLEMLRVFHDRASGKLIQAKEQTAALIEHEKNFEAKMFWTFFKAGLEHDLGDYQAALLTLEPFIETNPNDPDVTILQAKVLMKSDQYDQAKDLLKAFLISTDGADEDWIPAHEARELLKRLEETTLTLTDH
ncbi:hypothetical protein CEE37_10565 [candidate division LCP-89 bacterium B3_LCP]|uniref:Tetratricopeptide repeat protein n=1 Tax=candidate division LCP-89 bacterium B3_LCP TaxID=2012998 RepID=A0A532UXP7_UNCL8|nr:MAG: hypothetical protein CEE37_10565 [candidate division LCP-89 bacterium B3_LCP]